MLEYSQLEQVDGWGYYHEPQWVTHQYYVNIKMDGYDKPMPIGYVAEHKDADLQMARPEMWRMVCIYVPHNESAYRKFSDHVEYGIYGVNGVNPHPYTAKELLSYSTHTSRWNHDRNRPDGLIKYVNAQPSQILVAESTWTLYDAIINSPVASEMTVK